MFSIKSKIMKKVIYFFAIGLIFSSCNITKAVYDDVYDATVYNETSKVKSENGYSDYIKSEEKNYKIEPEEDHYSYVKAPQNTTNYTFSNPQNSSYFYQCAYHNYSHSHLTDDFMCRELRYPLNAYNSYNCGMYNQYGYNPYSYTNPYGSTYGYSYNNYGYGITPYNAYWGNYGNIDPYTNQYFSSYNGNNNNYIATNSVSSNHSYGHRSGTHLGTRSSNNTSFPNTVKSSSHVSTASNKPMKTTPNSKYTSEKT